MQDAKSSAIESGLNTVITFAGSWIFQVWIEPMLGITINVQQAFWVTVISTLIGGLRQYVLRRWFEAASATQEHSTIRHGCDEKKEERKQKG
jgi:membrane protein YqaA with SNARE-associated domain